MRINETDTTKLRAPCGRDDVFTTPFRVIITGYIYIYIYIFIYIVLITGYIYIYSIDNRLYMYEKGVNYISSIEYCEFISLEFLVDFACAAFPGQSDHLQKIIFRKSSHVIQ